MKKINLKELIALAMNAEDKVGDAPVLVWFHSNPEIDKALRELSQVDGYARTRGNILDGHEHYIDINGDVLKLSEHPEVADAFHLPGSYNESTRFFVYFDYMEQLKDVHIQYVRDLARISRLPVICLVNDYSKDEHPNFDISGFVEYDFCEAPILDPVIEQ